MGRVLIAVAMCAALIPILATEAPQPVPLPEVALAVAGVPAPAAGAVPGEFREHRQHDLLLDYTGVGGEKYTADTAWLTDCNGESREPTT